MKCIVTGGAGFLGRHLVRRLVDEGHEVRVLDAQDPEGVLPEGVDMRRGDICNGHDAIHAVKDVDVVWHLAAEPRVEMCRQVPDRTTDWNVTGTVKIVREAVAAGVGRVVFASSAAACRPRNIYGEQKRAAERLGRKVCRGTDAEFVPLRFENIYGPGANAGVVKAFLEAALEGGPLQVHGDGKQERDYLYVEDAVSAALKAGMEPDPPAESRWSVGTGETITIKRLADMVRDLVGGGEVVHTDARPGDVRHSCATPGPFRDWTGWRQVFGLDEGLAVTLEAMRREDAA